MLSDIIMQDLSVLSKFIKLDLLSCELNTNIVQLSCFYVLCGCLYVLRNVGPFSWAERVQ